MNIQLIKQQFDFINVFIKVSSITEKKPKEKKCAFCFTESINFLMEKTCPGLVQLAPSDCVRKPTRYPLCRLVTDKIPRCESVWKILKNKSFT